MVWGSDWPHVGHADDAVPKESVLMDLFGRCVPDEAVRRKILIDNPARLYGF
ncbi:amidohydrolase family protein [Bradyrhizobium sp.]|uniref:amidohydrolase family protein n=1 Tax=Bradyrhizobium sp. TaxID=376 RepID=UPI0025C1D889|nr:amidohydrolase family protein [Bradyrhizobium sp.]